MFLSVELFYLCCKKINDHNSASLFFARYTSKADAVYAIVLKWPATTNLTLGAPKATEHTTVTMLGYEGKFAWEPIGDKGGIIVTFPAIPINKLPSESAWVLMLENIM